MTAWELDDKAWRKHVEQVTKLDKHDIVVGVLDDEALATIAYFLHMGTRKNKKIHTPARPFFDITSARVDDDLFKLKLRALFNIQDGANIESELKPIGSWLAGQVQNTIDAGVEPENAESTVKKKGFNHPLIGNLANPVLRNSISFTVRLR